MSGRDDIEESSSSSGYSPSDYSDSSEDFQEEIMVPSSQISQLACRDDAAIDTPAELDRAHSSGRAEGSLKGCERLPRWSAKDIMSLFTERELGRILATRRVSREIGCRVPRRHERSCSPPEGYMAFNDFLFRIGARLPLHPFFLEILEYA